MERDKSLRYAINTSLAILCLLSFWLHFYSNFDVYLQNFFYSQKHWMIHPADPLFHALLYSAPKALVILLGALAFFLLIFRKNHLPSEKKVALVTFLLCISLFPVFINNLKEIFRQPCPWDLEIFGGYLNTTLLDYFLEHKNLRCFPGAHASAPFSLLSLTYFFSDRYNRRLYLFALIPFAIVVSMYQVARGAHFVTDTTLTAFSAWLFAEVVHYVLRLIPWSSRSYPLQHDVGVQPTTFPLTSPDSILP